MFYVGLFKRIIPFVLTFAAGLLIASIFVPIGFPNAAKWREARRAGKCHERHQLRMENEELREKVRTQRSEIQELRRDAHEWDSDTEILNAVPPVILEEHKPLPPPPAKRPKHPRTEILR
jgi:hypothetical protein